MSSSKKTLLSQVCSQAVRRALGSQLRLFHSRPLAFTYRRSHPFFSDDSSSLFPVSPARPSFGRRSLDSFFNDPFFRSALRDWSREFDFPEDSSSTEGSDLVLRKPLTDIVETETAFLFHCELPGLTKEQVKITHDPHTNCITIEGSSKTEKETDEGETTVKTEKGEEKKVPKIHRVERSSMSFERVFKVPEGVDLQNISAKMEHGVLSLELPKKVAEKPKAANIEIK